MAKSIKFFPAGILGNTLLLFLLLFVPTMFSVKATVYTVDNNPGADADFSTLQSAVGAASNYDTIYISGSPYVYDGTNTIRVHKTGLVLIGPGYFLGYNPKTQSNNNDAKIYQIRIGQGGDSCVIMGLNLSETNKITYVDDQLSDGSEGTMGPQGVIIKRNLVYQVRLGVETNDDPITGTTIEQNMFNKNTYCIYINSYNVSNLIIRNNIMNVVATANIFNSQDHQLYNSEIYNNVFSYFIRNINNARIYNNIFRASTTIYLGDSNLVENNLCIETNIESGTNEGNVLSGNLTGQSPLGLFITDSPLYDMDFQLGASSPAKGIGVDGADAGAYGMDSYRLSGLPPIPSVYEIKTVGYGNSIEGMNVTIKIKSND